MSKHPKVPAPVPKVFPSIIRATGTRVVLLAVGCAALVVLGGGGYLLSRSKLAPQPAKPTQADTKDSKVLSSSTPKPETSQASTTAQTVPAPATPAQTAPVKSQATTGAPSFDLKVDTSLIQKAGLALTIPFTVQRHGGLTTPIVPGTISITSGGLLANVTVQLEHMITPDKGEVVLIPLNLTSNELNVHLSATSGDALASTSFTYKLRR